MLLQHTLRSDEVRKYALDPDMIISSKELTEIMGARYDAWQIHHVELSDNIHRGMFEWIIYGPFGFAIWR